MPNPATRAKAPATSGVPANASSTAPTLIAPYDRRSAPVVPNRATIGMSGRRPPSWANPLKAAQNDAAPRPSPAAVMAGT